MGDMSSGNGNGQVPFSVDANSGPARQGTLSIGGRTVTVAQASGCTYTVTPPSLDVAPAGGSGTASISTGAGCPWNAASAANWIAAGRSLQHRPRAGAVGGCCEQWTGPDWNSHGRLDCAHSQPRIILRMGVRAAFPYVRPERRERKRSRDRNRRLHVDCNEQCHLIAPTQEPRVQVTGSSSSWRHPTTVGRAPAR